MICNALPPFLRCNVGVFSFSLKPIINDLNFILADVQYCFQWLNKVLRFRASAGTPADCTSLGISGTLFPSKPDLVAFFPFYFMVWLQYILLSSFLCLTRFNLLNMWITWQEVSVYIDSRNVVSQPRRVSVIANVDYFAKQQLNVGW